MTLGDIVLRALRRPQNPATRKLRAAAEWLLSAEVPVTPVHRLLVTERFVRRLVTYNLARAFYHQPLLRAMCARSGKRLILDAGSGLPLIDGIALELGDDVRITGRSSFFGARRPDGRKPRVVVGNGTYLGHFFTVTTDTEVILGEHVLVADEVRLYGYDSHPIDPVARRSEPAPVDPKGGSRIVVGNDVWLCQGALVLKGVTIGDGAVVAAHAVVTKDVPSGVIVAGNPARPVGTARPTLRAAG